MKNEQSGWKYYVPEHGETVEESHTICTYFWQSVFDAEEAAKFAAEDDWDNHDGWDRGIGCGPDIVVIDPDGTETKFSVTREATIAHNVCEFEEGE